MVVVCMSTDSYMTTWPGVWITGRVLLLDSQNSDSVPGLKVFFIVELFNSASLFINLLVRHFLFAYEWENGDRNRCTVRLYAKHARSLSGLPYGLTDSYSTHTRKQTPNVQQSGPTYGCLSSNSLKKFKRYICIFYWQLIIS